MRRIAGQQRTPSVVVSRNMISLSVWRSPRRQSTVSDRVVTWIVSAKMIEDKPLHGIGFGRFNLEWEKYFQRTHSKIEFQGFDGSHNTFLTMGAEVGVPTLLVFLLMMYYQVRMCAGVYKRLGEEMELERSFVVMVMGLAVMYVFTGWFSDLRWNTVQNTLMFLCFGLVCGLKHHLEEEDLSAVAADESNVADVAAVEERSRMSYTNLKSRSQEEAGQVG